MIEIYETIKNCRICSSKNIKEVLDLGDQPPANSLFKAIDEMRKDIKELKGFMNRGKGAATIMMILGGLVGSFLYFLKWVTGCELPLPKEYLMNY